MKKNKQEQILIAFICSAFAICLMEEPARCESTAKADFNIQMQQFEQINKLIRDVNRSVDEGCFEQAIKLCDQIIARRQAPDAVDVFGMPTEFLAYTLRGDANRELGRYEDALQDYTRAVELNPDIAIGRVRRSAMLRKVGRIEEARADEQKALQLEPMSAGTYISVLNLEPKAAQQYRIRGDGWVTIGDYSRAAKDYAKFLTFTVSAIDRYQVLISQGDALWKQQKRAAAIEDYCKALRVRLAVNAEQAGGKVATIKPVGSPPPSSNKRPTQAQGQIARPVTASRVLKSFSSNEAKQASDLLAQMNSLNILEKRFDREASNKTFADIEFAELDSKLKREEVEAQARDAAALQGLKQRNDADYEKFKAENASIRSLLSGRLLSNSQLENIKARNELNDSRAQRALQDLHNAQRSIELGRSGRIDADFCARANGRAKQFATWARYCADYLEVTNSQLKWKLAWNTLFGKPVTETENIDMEVADDLDVLVRVAAKIASMVEFGASNVRPSADAKVNILTSVADLSSSLEEVAKACELCVHSFELSTVVTADKDSLSRPPSEQLREIRSKLLAVRVALDAAAQQWTKVAAQ